MDHCLDRLDRQTKRLVKKMKLFTILAATLFGAVVSQHHFDENGHRITSTTPAIPTEFCGEYNVTIQLDIRRDPYEVTLRRLCNQPQSGLIDFNLAEQNLTIFKGFDGGNHGFFPNKDYGEKFILIVRNIKNPTPDKVILVPERVHPAPTSVSLDILPGKMIIKTHEEPEDKPHVHDSYTNATIIPTNVHVMRAESVKLVPGWKGDLDASSEQHMIPEHGSSFMEQNVVVTPGWNLQSTFYSVHAKVAVGNHYQDITIFFKTN